MQRHVSPPGTKTLSPSKNPFPECSKTTRQFDRLIRTDIQGNEVYGGSSNSAGIFLHRSSNNAIVKGEAPSLQCVEHTLCFVVTSAYINCICGAV